MPTTTAGSDGTNSPPRTNAPGRDSQIRPKLEALRAAGDFAPAATRKALLDLGIEADAIQVTAMRTPIGRRHRHQVRCTRFTS